MKFISSFPQKGFFQNALMTSLDIKERVFFTIELEEDETT